MGKIIHIRVEVLIYNFYGSDHIIDTIVYYSIL